MSAKTAAGEPCADGWAEQVVANLRAYGYFYDPDFSSRDDSADILVGAASTLGSLLIPPGTDRGRPVLLTRPSLRVSGDMEN